VSSYRSQINGRDCEGCVPGITLDLLICFYAGWQMLNLLLYGLFSPASFMKPFSPVKSGCERQAVKSYS